MGSTGRAEPKLRPDLPPDLPKRMEALRISAAGYPVPWFVGWFDGSKNPVSRGQGEPDFRTIHPTAFRQAIAEHRCWICGQRLGVHLTFLAGPMCGINSTSSEPPSHLECATWAAKGCPFLAHPERGRREKGKPFEHMAEGGILRNPGVALVLTTKGYRLEQRELDTLVNIGDPEHVEWYAEGRVATRPEILGSIDSGFPQLVELCEGDEKEITELELLRKGFIERWVPEA